MYYYYWFAGRRLLNAPIEALAESDIAAAVLHHVGERELDPPLGRPRVGRPHRPGLRAAFPADQFIEDILPFLADERYMTIDGRKIVAIYRAGPDS